MATESRSLGAWLFGGFVALAAGGAAWAYWPATPAPPVQPVPFSHRHHAGDLGIDCRHCHDTVEVGPAAGMPPMHTCATCHYPARAAPAAEPLRWRRVAKLAEFTYFDHSIHVVRGVACVTCHGRVDRMERTFQPIRFTMLFCLDCHRDPAPRLRPPAAVFDMDWQPPTDRRALGERLMTAAGIEPAFLTHCYVCHR